MDASEKIKHIDVEEENETSTGIDRCLSSSDRHSHTSNRWSSGKAPKIKLKQLPAGFKYAFLCDNSYHLIVNSKLTSEELILLLNNLHKYPKLLHILSMTFWVFRLVYAWIGYIWKTSQIHLTSIKGDCIQIWKKWWKKKSWNSWKQGLSIQFQIVTRLVWCMPFLRNDELQLWRMTKMNWSPWGLSLRAEYA